MSRLAKKAIIIPQEAKVESRDGLLVIKGPKGELSRIFSADIKLEIKDNKISIHGDLTKKTIREQIGLTFALINNMIKGVIHGYTKELEVVGVGYRAQIQGANLSLQLGFSHAVTMPIPKGIKIQTPKPTQLIIEGIDKEAVGDTAAKIRAVLPPEPYKGKGIRYKQEYVRRKLGKAVTK